MTQNVPHIPTDNNAHWQLPELDLPKEAVPSYIPHATRTFEQIQEMGAALNEPYPHFLAVLTPERTFLHYILSGLVCNAAFPEKEPLFSAAERLYKENVQGAKAQYTQECERIFDESKGVAEWAYAYYEHRKGHHPLTDIPPKWEKIFDATYDKIQENFYNGIYLPGSHDKQELNTIQKVFCAICKDEYEREEIQKIAKAAARQVIQKEISAHKLEPLPLYKKTDWGRKNTVVAGMMGAGKSHFIEKLFDNDHYGGLNYKRKDAAFIDMDEWKEFLLHMDGNVQHSDPKLSWNKRSYDECHQIRRKIFDELEEQATKDRVPNVLFTTSQLSQRALDWMTENNVPTTLHLFYCDPDQALKNSLERQQKKGRYLSTETLLNTVGNLAKATAYLLDQSTHKNKKLNVQIEDNTKGRSEPTTTILTSSEDGVVIHDLDALFKIQQGLYINSKATSPKEAYKPFAQEQLNERVRAILRPHEVYFAEGNRIGNHAYMFDQADKKAGEDTITIYTKKISPSQLAALKRIDPKCDERPKKEHTVYER